MPTRLIVAYILIAMLFIAAGTGIAMIRRNQRRRRRMMRGQHHYKHEKTSKGRTAK